MANITRPGVAISVQALRRMPQYLFYLRQLAESGHEYVSSARVAERFGLTEIQVRKDFAAVASMPGKPKAGFLVRDLINGMETSLGFRNTKDAVLVGAGSLGSALMNYRGFQQYGLHIIAAFDNNPERIGREIAGKTVLSSDMLVSMCQRLHVQIGIITVPDRYAQHVCDQLVEGGVKALWNFTSVQLTIPDGVLVQNENMAASLAILSRHLDETLNPSAEE